RQGEAGFRFFTFTPFGVPMLALAIVYMTFARRWLPERQPVTPSRSYGTFADRVMQYELSGHNFRLRLTAESPLVGRTMGDLEHCETFGLDVLAIERRRRPLGNIWDLGDSLDLIRPGVRTELGAG